MQVTLEFDEDFYQDLVKEVGEHNISEYIQSVLRPQLQPLNKQSSSYQTLPHKILPIEKKRQALAQLAGSWEGDELRIEQPLSDKGISKS